MDEFVLLGIGAIVIISYALIMFNMNWIHRMEQVLIAHDKELGTLQKKIKKIEKKYK